MHVLDVPSQLFFLEQLLGVVLVIAEELVPSTVHQCDALLAVDHSTSNAAASRHFDVRDTVHLRLDLGRDITRHKNQNVVGMRGLFR